MSFSNFSQNSDMNQIPQNSDGFLLTPSILQSMMNPDNLYLQQQQINNNRLANNMSNAGPLQYFTFPMTQQFPNQQLLNTYMPNGTEMYNQAAQMGVSNLSMNQVTMHQLANSNMLQVDLDQLNKRNSMNKSKRGNNSNSNIKLDPNAEIEYDNKNRPLVFSCKVCPRKFSMNSRLTQHMRCHDNVRPYECDVCKFAFTQKSYLVRHAAVHKEERPYECAICKKTYKHYGSLANHRKTHKNNKMSDPNCMVNNEIMKAEPSNIDNNNNNLVVNYAGNDDYNYSQATNGTTNTNVAMNLATISQNPNQQRIPIQQQQYYNNPIMNYANMLGVNIIDNNSHNISRNDVNKNNASLPSDMAVQIKSESQINYVNQPQPQQQSESQQQQVYSESSTNPTPLTTDETSIQNYAT